MAGISKEERLQLLRSIKTADDNYKRGMYALAEPTYRRAIDTLGDGAAEICDCLQNLAVICIERKDLNDALKIRIRLLLLLEERFGGDHVKTISLMDDIALLYENLGRTEESRDMYERARKASERSLWADQQNEADTTDDAVGIPIAPSLTPDFQYSETAKSVLDTEPDDSGIVEYQFGTANSTPERARSVVEETMKLPKVDKSQTPPAPPVKDPQLETLILDRKDIVMPLSAENKTGNGSAPPAVKSHPSTSQNKITALDPVAAEMSIVAAAAARPDFKAELVPKADLVTKAEPDTDTEPSKESEPEWKTFSGTMKRPTVLKVDEDFSAEESTELVPLDKKAIEKEKTKAAKVKVKAKVDQKDDEDIDEKQAVSVNLFQSAKQRNTIIGLIAGSFLLILLIGLFAGHGNPEEDFQSMPHRYRTVDGEKLFFLSSPADCEIVAGSEKAKMRYSKYHADFRDSATLLFGPLFQHQIVMSKTKAALTDETNSRFFAEGSPELDLAEEMEEAARAAELTYLKLHHYPKKLDELEIAKRAYRNPFTGQLDKPVVQFASFGKKTQVDDGGMRKKLYDTAASGARWTGESKRHAGELSCYSVVIHTKKGDVNAFYIRGFDRDSKPLVGHDSSMVHTFVLENGKTKPVTKAQLPFKGKSTRPRVVWIVDESNLLNPIWLRFGGAIIMTLIAFTAGIVSVNINSNAVNASLKLVMAIAAIMAVVCLLSDMLP